MEQKFAQKFNLNCIGRYIHCFYNLVFFIFQMAKYPALQDEVEKISMTHVRGAEHNTKEQVRYAPQLIYKINRWMHRGWTSSFKTFYFCRSYMIQSCEIHQLLMPFTVKMHKCSWCGHFSRNCSTFPTTLQKRKRKTGPVMSLEHDQVDTCWPIFSLF